MAFHLNARLDVDGGDLFHDLGGRGQVDHALVKLHRVPVTTRAPVWKVFRMQQSTLEAEKSFFSGQALEQPTFKAIT